MATWGCIGIYRATWGVQVPKNYGSLFGGLLMRRISVSSRDKPLQRAVPTSGLHGQRAVRTGGVRIWRVLPHRAPESLRLQDLLVDRPYFFITSLQEAKINSSEGLDQPPFSKSGDLESGFRLCGLGRCSGLVPSPLMVTVMREGTRRKAARQNKFVQDGLFLSGRVAHDVPQKVPRGYIPTNLILKKAALCSLKPRH